LHMRVTSEFKVRPILRGLWDWLPWIELEWWAADCHWSCADYYVILPPPRNYTFLLHLTRGKGYSAPAPTSAPCRMAGWLDGWMNGVWTKTTFSLYPCMVTYHGDKLCTNHPLSSTYDVTTKCMCIIYMHND
jgi:hypothetical protein